MPITITRTEDTTAARGVTHTTTVALGGDILDHTRVTVPLRDEAGEELSIKVRVTGTGKALCNCLRNSLLTIRSYKMSKK